MVDLKIEFPQDFFKEEVRCGYTVSTRMKEVWAVELDLLQELLTVCNKHGLHCYADAGTLLGAVRHKGFIPWDDDIDVIMFRDDFEKLRKISAEEFKAPYFFQFVDTDEKYIRGHAQLRNFETTAILADEKGKDFPFCQGIFIDIFILDGVIENTVIRNMQKIVVDLLNFLQYRLVMPSYELKIKGKIIRYIMKTLRLDYKKLFFLKEWIIKKGNITSCEYVAPLSFLFETKKRIRNRHVYDKVVWLDFENIKIPAPAGYDEFLKKRYGNYMEVKQVSTTHGSVFFDTNHSYKEYLSSKY